MTVFHWLAILIVALSFLLHGERKKNWKFLLIAVALMYGVFGFRNAYTVGIDTTGPYITKYETVCKRQWENMPGVENWLGTSENSIDRQGHDKNIALDWTMKLYYEATKGTYQGFIEFSSLITMIAFFYFVYRFSTSPIQSVLLYFGLLFYTFNFSALKQSLAMSVSLLAVAAILDKKPVKFTILVLLASMYHFPALVILPAYFIANMRIGRGYLVLLAVAFLATYLMRDRLLDWMTDVYSTALNDSVGRFLANKVIIIIAILIMAVIIRPPDPDDRVYCALLMMTGIAAVLQTFAGYNNTFERLADYYFQVSIVMIPMIFEDVPLRRQNLSDDTLLVVRRLLPYFVCAFAIWRFWSSATMPAGHLVPYSFANL